MVTKELLTAAFLLCLVSGQAWTESFFCKFRKDGFYPNPTDCSQFYRCVGRKTYSFKCRMGLEFQPSLSVCDWQRNVHCQNGRRPSSDSEAAIEPASTATTTLLPTTTMQPTTTTKTPTTTVTSTSTTAVPTTTPAMTTTAATDPTTTTTTATAPTARPTATHVTAYQPSCVGRRAGAMFRSPDDCSVYYWCVLGDTPLRRQCPGELVFNPDAGACDWIYNVDCFDNSGHVPSTQTTARKSTAAPQSKSATKSTAATEKPRSSSIPDENQPKAPTPVTFAPTRGGDSGCSRRVCYYTNWSQYRPGDGRFVPEDVDPFLCTHVVYAFAKLNGNHLAAFEWNDESTAWSTGMYERFNDLKRINPNLKTLLAVGGWNMGSAPFTEMVATAESRQDFADHSVTFLRSNGFDGLDLDWEYPANRGSPQTDRGKFTLLVKQLRETYDKDAAKNGGSPLLLTAAVAAGKLTTDTAYDIPQISQDLDFINLMSYDLHGSWEEVTGHHSGLYAHSSESGPQRFLNTDWAARHWVNMGCPKDKLVIGIPTYARTFTLSSAADTALGAAASGAGVAGRYTREGGFLSYYEVCTMMATADVKERIEDQKVPYLVQGKQWVGYEDVDSVTEKVRYVRANGYGGVMMWSLDLDDFTGKFCGQGKYPLWSAVNTECQK